MSLSDHLSLLLPANSDLGLLIDDIVEACEKLRSKHQGRSYFCICTRFCNFRIDQRTDTIMKTQAYVKEAFEQIQQTHSWIKQWREQPSCTAPSWTERIALIDLYTSILNKLIQTLVIQGGILSTQLKSMNLAPASRLSRACDTLAPLIEEEKERYDRCIKEIDQLLLQQFNQSYAYINQLVHATFDDRFITQLNQALLQLDEATVVEIVEEKRRDTTLCAKLVETIKDVQALAKRVKISAEEEARIIALETASINYFSDPFLSKLPDQLCKAIRSYSLVPTVSMEYHSPGELAKNHNDISQLHRPLIEALECTPIIPLDALAQWEKEVQTIVTDCSTQLSTQKEEYKKRWEKTFVSLYQSRVTDHIKKICSKIVNLIYSPPTAALFAEAKERSNPLYVPRKQLDSEFAVRFFPDNSVEIYFTSRLFHVPFGKGGNKVVRSAWTVEGDMATATIRHHPEKISSSHRELIWLEKVKGREEFVQLLEILPPYLSQKRNKFKIRFNMSHYPYDLRKLLRKKHLRLPEKISIALQLARGLSYLHDDLHALHRDLKMSNVLLTEKRAPKISDLGSCCKRDDASELQKNRSTRNYVPPEFLDALLQEQSLESVTTTQLDIWCLGLLFIELFVGERACPWSRAYEAKDLQKFWKDTFPKYRDGALFENKELDPRIVTLLRQMTSFDPSQRPSAQAVCSALEQCVF